MTMKTLIDLLESLRGAPPVRGITFYADDLDRGVRIRHVEVPDLVGASMAALRQQGVRGGDRVIVPFDSDPATIWAFLGLIGIGAVPLSIKPHLFGSNAANYVEFVATVAEKYGATAILGTESVLSLRLPVAVQPLPRPSIPCTPDYAVILPDDLAFVQLSSGSTGFPKAIPVHHRRAVDNIQLILQQDGRNQHDVCASWLPLYHDMGLIGMLSGLAGWSEGHLHNPAQYLIDPLGWLEHLSRHQGTIFVTPNFGIDYALRRVREAEPEELARLDLSSLRFIYIGSEPINMTQLDEFCRLLSPYGMRREAFKPCYGMAEAVLMVTCAGDGEAPTAVTLPGGASAVCVGHLLSPFELRIVDEDGAAVADGELGEIELRGGTLAERYFESEVPISPEGAYFATGDLGMVQDGRLYIAGRAGDRMKVNGQSYFGSAFEQVVETLPFIRAGRSVVLQPTDEVVVLAEVQDPRVLLDVPRYRREVSERVFEKTGIKVEARNVQFLRYGQIEKTSSGKLRRNAMSKALLAGTLRKATLLGYVADRLHRTRTRVVGTVALRLRALTTEGRSGASNMVTVVKSTMTTLARR